MISGELQAAAEKGERTLSAEEAERLAAAIRPSWEMAEEAPAAKNDAREAIEPSPHASSEPAVHASTAATPAEDAPDTLQASPSRPPEPLIKGIPTVAIGGPDASTPAQATESGVTEQPANGPPHSSVKEHAGESAVSGGQATSAAAGSEAAELQRGAAHAPAGKTKVGLGEPSAGMVEDESSTTHPAPDAAALAGPMGSRDAQRTASDVEEPPASRRADDNDPFEIPVSGPNKRALQVGIALVGAAVLLFAGSALLGSRSEDAPSPPSAAGTVERPAAKSPATATAPPSLTASPATAPPPDEAATASPAAAPPSSATAAATAPGPPAVSAKPSPSLSARSSPAAAPRAPAAEKQPAAPPPPRKGPSANEGKKGGGIIRDAPF